MTQRTFAQARTALDALSTTGVRRRRLTAELERLEQEYTARVRADVEHRHADLKQTLDRLYDAQDAVEDRLRDLRKRGAQGLVEPAEYRDMFQELTDERRRLHRSVRALGGQAAGLAQMEDEPLTYLDNLFSKYPLIAPDFPW